MGRKNTEKKQGDAAFDAYYENVFGARWSDLKNALLKDSSPIKLRFENCKPYFLDAASVFAAYQLPLDGASSLLDMCAAPGGKSLVIASRMEEKATLVCNERSGARRQRLLQTCRECLPDHIFSRVRITASDGAILCKNQTASYERILLDAPCSSERHVLNDKKYLDLWTASRVKSLSIEQWALLSSAYRLLEEGGVLVYSTCALTPLENDEVLRRLLKKFPDASVVYDVKNPFDDKGFQEFFSELPTLAPERTEFGFHILPDKNNGAGPIWFSVVKKGRTQDLYISAN